MKKFLVLCVSAAMLLSTAAASLAAATVSGEYKYDMYVDESNTDGAKNYGKHELLYGVAGNVSDSVYASAKFLFKHGSDGADGFETSSNWTSEVDEFYATAKYSWGTVKVGDFEYKFTPSRQELKSAGKHVFGKTDANFQFTVPVAEGFTVDAVVAPEKNAANTIDNGAYALGVTYKAENWGVQVSHADFALDTFGDLNAIDVYYNINENMKVYADAVDYSENKGKSSNDGLKYKDGFDPILGFAWSNIAGLKLNAGAEYAINKRYDGDTNTDPTKSEYTEYMLKAEYILANNISVTAYHFIKGDSCTQDKLRLKFAF